MSYNTAHNLHWEPSTNPTEEQMVARLMPLMAAGQEEVYNIAINAEPARWYDSDDHLVVISREYPETLFTIECSGEDGDQWTSFFKNGQSYTEKPTPPVFNPDKLQDPTHR